jgi:hypothetical protein
MVKWKAIMPDHGRGPHSSGRFTATQATFRSVAQHGGRIVRAPIPRKWNRGEFIALRFRAEPDSFREKRSKG